MSQRFTYHIRPSATPFAQTHTFSAKEKDSETGLSVTSLRSVSSFSLSQIQTSLVWHSLMRRFGARYYSSDLSIFQLMTDAINDAKKDPFFVQNKNYNCWGASLALMREEKLYGEGLDSFLPWDSHGVGLNSPGLFDLALNNYTPVRQETASVGKTIMRIGAPCWGKTTHASIFLGVDNSGNEYTFSKNGWNLRPVVCESHGLVYKYVVGRTPFESGYYSK